MSHHHTSTVHTAHDLHDEAASRQPWTVLALALVAQVLVVLDISVVNTALPTIAAMPSRWTRTSRCSTISMGAA